MEDDEMVDALDEAEDAPEATDSEIDRLDPESDIVELSSGIEVKVLPLRTRQLFKLLRIVTHGAGQALQNAGLNFSDDPGVFVTKLTGIVLFSIPDAEQETLDFLQSMVEPVGLSTKPVRDLSKQERERNIELWAELNKEMWNPDPGDTIDLVEKIVSREAKDIQALGKKISRLIELASKTGQLSPGKPDAAAPEPQDGNSSENSAGSSTLSPTSTTGRTTKSSNSRSAGSAKSAPRSRSASGKKNAPAAL